MADNQENNRPLEEENRPEDENRPEGETAGEDLPYIGIQSIALGILPGFILRKVGQAYMVMPAGPRMKDYQGMITLNETGAFLFKESQKPDVTKEALIEACQKEYGATAEEALQAVDSFIIQCADCGLFEKRIKYFDKKTGIEVSEDALNQ